MAIYIKKISKKLNVLSSTPSSSSSSWEFEDAGAVQKCNFQFDQHSFIAVTG